MHYLVDGHNLIPKIPGMTLEALDDESELISLLQEFCRKKRASLEVFFDNAPPGEAGERSHGLVKAHFVRRGMTADQAIRSRLERLGKKAAEWTVVSSDREVLESARRKRARTVSAEDFSRQLQAAIKDRGEAPGSSTLSPEELDEWLDLFGGEE